MARDRVRPRAEDNRDSAGQRCEAVYRATLAIATELSLDAVLQKIVDAARELVNARYGALGVVDEKRRQLTGFIVSGVTAEQVALMGPWPRGLGLLGELIHFPRPLRVKDISRDPRSVGFPPHHPSMTSFLGVPIIRGDRVLGNFYMTDKQGAEEFSEADEETMLLRFERNNPLDKLTAVTRAAEIIDMRRQAQQIFVEPSVRKYILEIIRRTRDLPSVSLGASPRASLALYRASQALALINGRDFVTPDDVKRLARPVLAHRLILSTEAFLHNVSKENLIADILSAVPVPAE